MLFCLCFSPKSIQHCLVFIFLSSQTRNRAKILVINDASKAWPRFGYLVTQRLFPNIVAWLSKQRSWLLLHLWQWEVWFTTNSSNLLVENCIAVLRRITMSSSSKLRVKESRTFEKKINAVICFPLFEVIWITPNIIIHFQCVMTFAIKVNWNTFCPAPD